jgi:DNA-binding response OmpR family regulator
LRLAGIRVRARGFLPFEACIGRGELVLVFAAEMLQLEAGGARIDALLRRFLPPKETFTETIGDLVLDTRARRAERNGQHLDLTAREFDLLLYLAVNRDRTVSREMLARDVWRENSRYTPIDNVIDVQMARLRKKIDDPFSVKLLQTVRGVGFCLRVTRT